MAAAKKSHAKKPAARKPAPRAKPNAPKKPAAKVVGHPGEWNWSRFNPSLREYIAEHRKHIKRNSEILWVRCGGVKSGEYRPFYAGVGADGKLHVYRVPPALVMNADPTAKWTGSSNAAKGAGNDSYKNISTEDVTARIASFLYGDPKALAHAWT